MQGDRLLADLRDVPKKLAQLVTSGAFASRSCELNGPATSQRTGKTYGTIVSGLALLGAKLPAVRTLDDIVALYSADADDEQRTVDVPAGEPDPRLVADAEDSTPRRTSRTRCRPR